MSLQVVDQVRSFGGAQVTYAHASEVTGCTMRFSVFQPPQAERGPVPVLFFLSGLTCTEQNFVLKGGAQRYAAEHGLMLVGPDTSPRGLDLPGEDDSWDFGTGAGFYVDATQEPWSKSYRMYSYVTRELPALVGAHLPADLERQGVTGHSMGGHGALVMALRNPDQYRSVSAFAPICAPTQCAWGEKAFSGYLGADRAAWRAYDATALIKTTAWDRPILVDQGSEDGFLAEQLHPHLLRQACEAKGIPLQLRLQEGYDHSYFFVSTFLGDHIAHHARALRA